MKKRTSKNSPLFTRAHLYTLKGVCVLRRLLAEGISANADTGELHSPTEINFLPRVYFQKEIG
ncbi:hypothetical protein B9N58_04985 [Finegoldia magna]|uniref:Uncharacterized protein n=1 Tax=Moryella indoligenes TaxID=371674 RepID=A0AAE3V8T6_9FIRM|nr:hypothetical protein [Moryella indoligenes]OXZ40865.1 hypothetical protein B9N58_04985 [Finegoldia magna]